MPSTTTMAGAFLLAGMAIANPLTTLEVCPDADPKIPACTVTAQHQSISTCFPTSTTCSTETTGTAKSCSTGYSFSTWAYVSTVIPCGWDGTTISSCTVTKTDQVVPCSATATTITSVFPIHTSFPDKNATNTTASTEYSTSYSTISKQWEAPYNKLGPLAIPGYDGCELCKDCAPKDDGSRSQEYDVTECNSSGDEQPSCSQYPEHRVSSKAAPGSSSPVSAVNSIKTSVSSAGTYTFTFTNTAPAATVTSDGHKITIPPRPWFNYQTRTCHGPTNFDFTVTVTKTIFVHAPFKTSTGSNKTPVDPTNAMHWGNWNPPVTTPAGGRPAGPTGGAGKPAGESFVIPANSGSGSKYSSVRDQYIGFPNGGDDASIVSGRDNAAKFHFDSEGNLMFGDKYVSTSTGAGYRVFELSHNKPSGSGPKFSIGADGSFSLPGAGFCSTGDTFFITYGGSPSGCKPVNCNLNEGKSSSASGAPTQSGNDYHWGAWMTTESDSSSNGYTTTTSASYGQYTTTSNGGPSNTYTSTSGGPSGGPSNTYTSTTGGPSGSPSNGPSNIYTSTTGSYSTTYSTTTPVANDPVTTPATTPDTTTAVTPVVTTTTTTSSTGGPSVQTPGPEDKFSLQVNVDGPVAKRDIYSVGFSGDTAVLVSDASSAYAFQFSGSTLKVFGSDYTVGADAASGALGLKKYSAGAGNGLPSGWSLNGGTLSYPGASFCVSGGVLDVYFGAKPADCTAATVAADANPDTFNEALGETTTTTTTPSVTPTVTPTTLATSTVTTATTTTSEEEPEPTDVADPSADLDVADPTPTPKMRKRGGVLRARRNWDY